MVLRKTFIHDFSEETLTVENYSKTGIFGSDTTNNSNLFYHSPEYSLEFLNDLYGLFVDAGYTDVTKDDDNYMITILGFKMICLVATGSTLTDGSNYCQPIILPYGYFKYQCRLATSYNNTGGSNYISNENITNKDDKNDMSYNLLLKGDSNGFSIYYGSYLNPNTKYPFICLRKCKNIINDKQMFYLARGFNSSNYLYYYNQSSRNGLFFETDAEYVDPIFYGGSTYNNGYDQPKFLYCDTNLGFNTNYKYVTKPLLGYYGTVLMYSMIESNSGLFTSGNYYKIGTDVYYCENNVLFKVE